MANRSHGSGKRASFAQPKAFRIRLNSVSRWSSVGSLASVRDSLGLGGGLTRRLAVARATCMGFVAHRWPRTRQRDLIGAWWLTSTEACPPARPIFRPLVERGTVVIVVGIDPHKNTHTAVAVDTAAR